MSYSFYIVEGGFIENDVIHIVQYLNEQKSGLGNDFLVALDDTLERLENRYNRETPGIPQAKFDRFYGEPIKAKNDSPASAKKFTKYYVWYIIEEKKKEVVVLAIEYAPRDPNYLRKLLENRKTEGES